MVVGHPEPLMLVSSCLTLMLQGDAFVFLRSETNKTWTGSARGFWSSLDNSLGG